MNRIFILAALGCGLLGGVGAAQQPAPMPPAPAPMGATPAAPVPGVVTGNCGVPGGCGGATVGATTGYAHHDARYGWNPLFRKLAFWKKDNRCGTCGGAGLLSRLRGLCGGNGYGAGAGNGTFNPYPNGVPGTLVFPNHPFARSPRDFFMTDGR